MERFRAGLAWTKLRLGSIRAPEITWNSVSEWPNRFRDRIGWPPYWAAKTAPKIAKPNKWRLSTKRANEAQASWFAYFKQLFHRLWRFDSALRRFVVYRIPSHNSQGSYFSKSGANLSWGRCGHWGRGARCRMRPPPFCAPAY